MAVFKKQPDYKQSGKKSNNTLKIGVGAAVVVVIIIAAYFLLANGGGTGINTPATANLTSSGTIFNVNSQQYLISLAGIDKGTTKVYVHVSKLPIFANPVLNVTLNLGNITKVNAGTAYANIGIELNNIGESSVTVKVSPLLTSLSINPDSQDIRVVQSTLYTSGQPSTTVTASTATTTISGGLGGGSQGTTASTTAGTTSSTTTVAQTNTTALDINTALKGYAGYGLILNFSVLYANTTQCTEELYNSTYIQAHSSAPQGGNTYENVSPLVPYNLSESISSIGGGNFEVNFTTKTQDPIFNNKVAAVIKVNASNEEVQSTTFSEIWEGFDQTDLRSAYIHALSVGGPCGVEV